MMRSSHIDLPIGSSNIVGAGLKHKHLPSTGLLGDGKSVYFFGVWTVCSEKGVKKTRGNLTLILKFKTQNWNSECVTFSGIQISFKPLDFHFLFLKTRNKIRKRETKICLFFILSKGECLFKFRVRFKGLFISVSVCYILYQVVVCFWHECWLPLMVPIAQCLCSLILIWDLNLLYFPCALGTRVWVCG